MDVRRLAALDAEDRAVIFDRNASIEGIRDDVSSIVNRVKEDGDAAIRDFSREFDGVDVDRVDITDLAAEAADRVNNDLATAIGDAAANIRAFHERQRRADWRDDFGGRELGRRFRPVRSAGVYVPGGTAAYPSSALMGVIPAVVAGVEHIAVATPPAADPDVATLAAIHEAGADRVYSIGGAQAIAALAYGTETVRPVDTVVGPGNRWVTAAKAIVRGDVAIDFLAGPSEILIIADATADSEFVAADLVAQAEHDTDAAVIAVTTDRDLATAVVEAVDRLTDDYDRTEIIRGALANPSSGVFVADSMAEACTFAEAYAPEHLAIQVADEEAVLEAIDSVGSIFLGPYSPVAAGDYATGTNHVLPTNGGARITGGLSVDTFLRAATVQRLDRESLADLRGTITTLARTEGFDAHATSVDRRFAGE